MVTVFEKEKRQKNLILVLVIAVLITSFVFYFGYFKKEEKPPIEILPPILPRKIEIDFEVLKNPILEELQVFEEIEPVKPEEMGRENPFAPY